MICLNTHTHNVHPFSSSSPPHWSIFFKKTHHRQSINQSIILIYRQTRRNKKKNFSWKKIKFYENTNFIPIIIIIIIMITYTCVVSSLARKIHNQIHINYFCFLRQNNSSWHDDDDDDGHDMCSTYVIRYGPLVTWLFWFGLLFFFQPLVGLGTKKKYSVRVCVSRGRICFFSV